MRGGAVRRRRVRSMRGDRVRLQHRTNGARTPLTSNATASRGSIPAARVRKLQGLLATVMRTYRTVSDKPDHPAIEHRILALWENEATFTRLRAQTRGGPPFSFIDGPITANNPMGVHHAWGRIVQGRLPALSRDAGSRLSVPERIRLPGLVGRGGGREGAGAQLEARDRGVRPRPVRPRLPRSGRRVLESPDRAVRTARPVDGLGHARTTR